MAPAPRRQRAADPVPAAAPEAFERTSAVVQAEIDAIGAQEAEADALLARLEAERPDVLRSGDDATAERHDAEIRTATRAIERQELLNPPILKALERELRQVQAQEDAARRAVQRAEAEAAVQTIVDRVEAGEYDEHAAAIATFLRDWNAAHHLAAEAGVETPHRRLRYRLLVPEHVKPAVMEPHFMFVDEQGAPTHGEHPYKDDGTLDRSRTRERRKFYRELQPAEKVRAVEHDLPRVEGLVNLPPIAHGRPDHWSASTLRAKKAGEA